MTCAVTKLNRLPCWVPFCRRTVARTGKFEHCTEIICGKHWRLVRRSRRLTYDRLRREIDRDPRPFWKMSPGAPERLRRIKVDRLVDRMWARAKAEATERAMGITA